MSHARTPVVALTVGEPAGIGPEIALRAAWALRATQRTVLIGDAAWLALLAEEIDPTLRLHAITHGAVRHAGLPQWTDCLTVIDCPLVDPVQPGQLNVRNARAILQTLDVALNCIESGQVQAMATAPLHKSLFNAAGIPFTGHTEYLAEKTATPHVVMMLATEHSAHLPCPLRVALATTHLPLVDVPAAITAESLLRTLRILAQDLRSKWGCAAPRILLTGLNPHAGEGGYLGREEIEQIRPAIEQARAEGIDAEGPYPADTLFQERHLIGADAVLAMYHDQGLPVLKFAGFGSSVNVTLGLPLIRTSVDHGTALDLAARGIGRADPSSMQAALELAARLVHSSSHPAP